MGAVKQHHVWIGIAVLAAISLVIKFVVLAR